MSSSSLIRLAGLAAVVSGVSFVIGDLLTLGIDLENTESAATVPYFFVFSLYLLGTVLLLLGLVGLYVSQSEAAGILGLVGFLAAFLGTALVSGAIWFELFIIPSLAVEAPELAEAELGLVGFILSFGDYTFDASTSLLSDLFSASYVVQIFSPLVERESKGLAPCVPNYNGTISERRGRLDSSNE